MRRLFTAGLAVSLLGGCVSSLDVQRFNPDSPQVGYPYRLRFTQYKIELTWRVVKCDASQPDGIKMKVSADVTETSGLDPKQFYVLDPRSLQGMFRTTEFKMSWYEDRTPKTVNSSVDDKTGEAIGSVITGIGKIAAAAVGMPGGPRGTACSADVRDALLAIEGRKGAPGQKAVTAAAQKAVAAQTEIVTRMAARATAAGDTLDDSTRRSLGQARDKLEGLTALLAIEQDKLKKLVDVLTDTKTVTWPPDGDELESTESWGPSADALERWNVGSLSNSFKVGARLVRLDWGSNANDVSASAGTPETTSSSDPRLFNGKIPGLPYREPNRIRLDLCTGGSCDGAGDDRIIASKAGLALQGGPLLYAPFRAQTFASTKSSVGFTAGGVLSDVESSQLRGAGSGAAEALKGAGTATLDAVTGVNDAKVKRTDAAIAAVKAKKALADANAALLPNPNADKLAQITALQTDATLATAEKSKLDAEAALDAARKALGQ